MKHIFYLFIFFSAFGFSQNSLKTSFVKKIDLQVESLVSVDNFGTTYFINNHVFYKKDASKTITYNNLQLGSLESVNAFNPLKINLFYKDFNTVIILDNRLAEIFKIDFNTLVNYKNVTHVSTGFDNTLWLFNQDTQQLELYDYKSNTTRTQTVPIQSTVLDLKSDYNHCWLLTKNFLYVYNYFGNLIKKVENDGFAKLVVSNENVILNKDNSLFLLKKNTENAIKIDIPNLLINEFFVTNETLYIYTLDILYEYQIKID